MSALVIHRSEGGGDQFVLPDLPDNISPALASLIAKYRAGFFSVLEEDHRKWGDMARRIHDFIPANLADLAAKQIIALHYCNPGQVNGKLSVLLPDCSADLLAVEMAIGNANWLLAQVSLESESLAALLAGRNALIEHLDMDRVDEAEAQTGVRRLNELDAFILNAPPSTKDDLFVKLLLNAQINTEGNYIDDEQATLLVREAQTLVGIGRVSPNVTWRVA